MSVPSNLVPTRILQLPEDPSPSDTGWMMYVNNGVTYKVQVNAVLNVSGVPSTRQINTGTGLTGGGDLSQNRTISIAPGGVGASELDNTGVTAGVYGDSANYPVLTIDANGRVTAATELSFPSPSGYVPTSREVIAGTGLTGGGALTTNVTLSADLTSANPEPVGAETAGTSTEIARADHVHPAIDLADTQQTVNELDITRGGTGSALTSPANGGIVYSDGTALQVSTAGTLGQVLVSAGAAAPTWGSALIVSDQPANYFYAGPTSGPNAPTAFRAMVNADLPASGVTAASYGTATAAPVITVNDKGVITSASTTTITPAVGSITGLGANVATWLATPSSANLAAAVTGETGTGSLVFNTTPTLSAPLIDGTYPYINFGDGSAVTTLGGRMWYNATDGSWNLGMGGNNITQQVGEELFVYGKASSAIADSPLQIVYQTGVVGASGHITFAPTVAGITDGNLILGCATENISSGNFGRITTYGTIHGINTTGSAYGETWADGDIIWYNPVTGNPTKTKPSAPNIKVQLGIITNAGPGGSGSFFVLVNPGSVLGGTDSNVQITSAADTQLLQYYGAGQYWRNVNPSSITGIGSLANALTIGTGLSGTSYNGSSPVTIAIDSTVATLTGVQTLTNKTLTTPIIETSAKILGTGVTSYTPFVNTLFSAKTQVDDYQIAYIQNISNGTNASADFVAYNDVSDVNSYFIDMGISSSNYTNPTYTVFPANSGYLYTGGGSSGQASDLVIGTSNAASDIILFTGDTLAANVRATITGNTGNFLINTTTDNGYKLAVNGTTNFSGASLFGSTVTLHADPTAALQAATKQYVDNAVSSGIHIHEQVYAETSAALAAVYTQGGTTDTITDITNTDTVTFASATPSVNDEIWLYTSAGNGLSTNTAYFVQSIVSPGVVKLSLTPGGIAITGLTNATGLSYNVRINSGVGAYLESSANATFTISGVTGLTVGQRVLVYNQSTGYWNGVYTITSLGSGSTKWKLTRATDQDQYAPQDVNGMGEGDYFFVTTVTESYVLTTEGAIIIGYTDITYTLFSAATVYTGTSPIDVTGSVISLTTVPATSGGTGTATVTTGDLLYGSAANTWSKLPLGVAYKSLTINASGTQVEWNAIALNESAAVAGTLGVANGGTGQSSYTDGQLLIGNSTGNTLSKSTLTAGTGINITNGSGTITVTANIDGGTF